MKSRRNTRGNVLYSPVWMQKVKNMKMADWRVRQIEYFGVVRWSRFRRLVALRNRYQGRVW